MIGPLQPPAETCNPQFAQLYIHNTDHEIDNRMSHVSGLDHATVVELQDILHRHKPFVRQTHSSGILGCPRDAATHCHRWVSQISSGSPTHPMPACSSFGKMFACRGMPPQADDLLCVQREWTGGDTTAPTASEVAAVMPGDGSEDVAPKEIRFHLRQGGHQEDH